MIKDPEVQALLDQIETRKRTHREQMRQLAHDHMRVVHPNGEPMPKLRRQRETILDRLSRRVIVFPISPARVAKLVDAPD